VVTGHGLHIYRVCDPFSFIFHFPSLSSLLLSKKLSLLSSKSGQGPVIFSDEVRWVPAAAGQPARRRHRAGTLTYIFFNFFCLFSSIPSPLFDFALEISHNSACNPRSKKKKEREVIPVLFHGSVCVFGRVRAAVRGRVAVLNPFDVCGASVCCVLRTVCVVTIVLLFVLGCLAMILCGSGCFAVILSVYDPLFAVVQVVIYSGGFGSRVCYRSKEFGKEFSDLDRFASCFPCSWIVIRWMCT